MSELAVYEPSANLPARPGVPGSQDFDSWVAVASEVVKLANVIYETPFVPDGLRSGPAVAAAILAGRELGLGPMTSLANVHVIKGKPALSAVLMRALVLAAGHQWRDVEVTDTRAVIEGRRRGETEWTRVTFTADQARTAKIDLGGYPQDKLYARATSRLARRKFADVIAGMPYSAEELEDGDTGTVVEAVVEGNGAGPAGEKPRTAQRKTTRKPHIDQGEQGINLLPEQQTYGGPPQPPLPGEDDTTTSTPAETAGPGWVGLIVKHFERLGFDDRDVRLAITAEIAGRDTLTSTKDLTDGEAKKVLDTLSRCKTTAQLQALLDTPGGADAPD